MTSKWDRAYAESPIHATPSPFISDCLPLVEALVAGSGQPITGLDVAGGTGRNALALAGLGVAMTVVDSSVVGLERAAAEATDRGLTLTTELWDLEADGLPAGEWDLMVKTYFLDRSALIEAASRLRPGGLLLFAQPTTTNLERHERPSRRFLIEAGELESLVATMQARQPLEIVECSEAWRSHRADPDYGPHEARLIVRRIG